MAQQVVAAWEDKDSRAAKKRKQMKPVKEGMTDVVVHSYQSKDEASENSVSECNGEYSPASQMTSSLTCTNPVSMGLGEDWEENSDDTSYQVTWSVGSGSTDHISNSDELDGHNIWNPMLELFSYADIGLLMEELADDMVLAMVALSCHFALDVLCDKSDPRCVDVDTFHEPEDEKEMEVEGPIVDETDFDTFLLDTASQRARDVRAFQDAFLNAFLGRGPSFDGERSSCLSPLIQI